MYTFFSIHAHMLKYVTVNIYFYILTKNLFKGVKELTRILPF